MEKAIFTNFEVPVDIVLSKKGKQKIWGKNWTRIEVIISENREPDVEVKILEFLKNNSKGKYSLYRIGIQNYKERKVVEKFIIGFEFSNDALMFKLKGASTNMEIKDHS